ncbi:pilus assembly protein PilO [Solemya pervernicosa gill symbiont]|uniref:Pilus assembly protein PilO n=1 Tax=Solemya pervernicosa gill symbiont TaxID=642797 RepID=A0A1T2LB26_9GAMM|nr:type 4a pilus biogenesis protein PilO [Solemya pervernicosa gill symbiont]OOZ42291.1 pilus assembly protein PilO [Solemya pervernicosa gill symbiont]
MTLEEIRNLDNDFGAWPFAIKAIVIMLICGALLFAGYWFDTQHQIIEFEKVQKKEIDLKKAFEFKQRKAANLNAYKEQLAEMQLTFGALLRQLPNKAEIADLLIDISQTGLASGLEFELFKPTKEVNREFYVEHPISIKVVGQYHDFGEFASGIAALPRIVTLHDIGISPHKSKDMLVMTARAKTYRYLEETR